MWQTIKRTGILIYLDSGLTYGTNVYAENIRLNTSSGFELSLDLNGNFRTKNKSGNMYIDAQELADGAIEKVKYIKINDPYVNKQIIHSLNSLETPETWILTFELRETRSFTVTPSFDKTEEDDSLILSMQ